MAVTGLGRWLAPGWFKRSHRVNIGLIDGANAPEFADYLFGDFTPTYLPTPVIPVTWNPSDTTADIALSGGDLTATSTAAGSKAVRGTPALTGKPYYEITVSGDALIAVGFHVTTTYAVDNFGVASFAYGASGDIHIVGSAQGVTLGTFGASSAVVSVAIDRPAKLAWFRLNGGDWNDNPSANPATGTGGYGISAYDGFDIVPWAYINTSGGSAVLNAGATAFAYAIPSGFYGPSPSAGGSPYTLTAASASYSLTGTAVALYEAKRMPANTASYALTGTAAITARGKAMPAATAAYALTGTAASVLEAKRLIGATASYVVSGTASTLTYTPVGSYSLTAASASYGLTGTAVTLARSRIMAGATASYALTGTAATLTKSTLGAFTLTATTAGYSLAGTAVALKDNRRLVATTASYALSGSAAGILRARVMAGATAAYSLTGTAAITKRGRSMAGASGSYALTGTDDALRVGRRLVATTAGYSLAGAANSMSRGRTLVGATRSYALTGTSVAFKRTYKLGAESGAYVYSGSGVVLINSADSLIAYPIYGRTISAAAITQGGPLIASPLAASTLTANPL